jgi:hypothetical protein
MGSRVTALRREDPSRSPGLSEAEADVMARSALSGRAVPPVRHGFPGTGAPSPPGRLAASSGHLLDTGTRQYFETRLGHDFSGVRVHHDAEARTAATSLGASAFTVGDHVFFGAERYAPQSESGRGLLAHELAHVVQQREIGVVTVQRQPVQVPPVRREPISAGPVRREPISAGPVRREPISAGPVQGGAVQAAQVDRINKLVEQFKATSDERQRLTIAENILTEIDRLAAGPDTDTRTEAVLRAEAAVLRAELHKKKGSSLKHAGVAAGGVVVVGGGPEDVPADVVAGVVFAGILIAALFSAAPKPDPQKVEAALDHLRDTIAQFIEPAAGITLAVQGERLAGNTRQLAIHLARLLALASVGGAPSGEPPKKDNRDDKHWWTEIKSFLGQIKQALKGASRKQAIRELVRQGFTEEQIAEIEARLVDAARAMGEEPPPFLPPP